jgi:SMP-30/Gluconolactonase/LRE-like region
MKSEVLLTNLAFGESPRWHADRLWVADWGTQEILAVDGDGRREVAVRFQFPSFQPICFDWLHDGRMLIVSAHDAALLRKEADGTLVRHADLSAISRGWNEIVVDGRGNAYVNGGGFDLMAGEKFSPGVVALVTPGGAVRRVADGLAFPNGMAVTADNSTLIVAESYGKKLTAFEIAADSSLSNRRTWAELGEGTPRRHLHRHRRRGLVRRCPEQTLRAGSRRRRGAADDRLRSGLLRVHARRRRRADTVRGDQGVARRGERSRRIADRPGAHNEGARAARRLAVDSET